MDYEYINKTYGVIMLDRNKSNKEELKENEEKNISLAKLHKEVAIFFGKNSFNQKTSNLINSIHNLGWF